MSNRIFYLRDCKKIVNHSNGNLSISRGEPLICIVSDRDADTGTIRYGYSIVHPNDRFNKSEAKRIATEKFFASPLKLTTTSKTGHEIDRDLVVHFLNNVGCKNNTARKTSKRWLKIANRKSTIVDTNLQQNL